jgi:hypothetical protein
MLCTRGQARKKFLLKINGTTQVSQEISISEIHFSEGGPASFERGPAVGPCPVVTYGPVSQAPVGVDPCKRISRRSDVPVRRTFLRAA